MSGEIVKTSKVEELVADQWFITWLLKIKAIFDKPEIETGHIVTVRATGEMTNLQQPKYSAALKHPLSFCSRMETNCDAANILIFKEQSEC